MPASESASASMLGALASAEETGAPAPLEVCPLEFPDVEFEVRLLEEAVVREEVESERALALALAGSDEAMACCTSSRSERDIVFVVVAVE